MNVCEHLGINPKYLRRGLMRWKKEKLERQALRSPDDPEHSFGGSVPEVRAAEESEAEAGEGPDALALYLQEVATIPPLSRKRENDLIEQMKRAQEELEQEALTAPAAVDYALARLDEQAKAAGETEPPDEARRQRLTKTAAMVRSLAGSRDRIAAALGEPSLPPLERKRFEQELIGVNAEIAKALKSLLPKSAVAEIASALKSASARLAEQESQAKAAPEVDRAAILAEVRRIEQEMKLPATEIRRRASSIAQSEARLLAARSELIDKGLRLVVRLARRYARRGLQLLDLIQDGNVGLLKAAEKFDPTLGLRFSTYAWWWIREFIRRGAFETARLIRVPTSAMAEWRELRRVRRELSRKLWREPTLAEIAAESGKSIEEVLRVVATMTRPVSLEAPLGEDSTVAQFIEDRAGPEPFERILVEEVRAQVARALAALPPKEEAVLRARFGLGDARPHTLEELAREYSITRERVRQIEHKALERLRRNASQAVASNFG
ncbi:MAG TPA: RNA polymerase sigma factor RpoD/SigA [candidate division Zixibacteria bacterium]|nr:RNA polymerase sigma factor RpoD/SigA [candidate division Zixibacteria bacterium]